MPSNQRLPAPTWDTFAAKNPWREAWSEVVVQFKRRWWIVALLAIAGAVALSSAKYMTRSKYAATTQLLFDPNGFRIFNNDLKIATYDANASINFVESQMAVLLSERVLTRVVLRECGLAASGGMVGPQHQFMAYCPADSEASSLARALVELRKQVFTKRTERSFVVDITAVSASPELAVKLTAGVVEAYIAEDAETRRAAADKLTADLGGRLDELRQILHDATARAETYRQDKSLVKAGDRLLVEQRLGSATAALNDARAKLDRAAARTVQLAAVARNPSALGALGADADTRTLGVLLERRNAIRIELAPLAARVGARHPSLVEVRSRLSEVERSIAAEMVAIRAAARSDHDRIVAEHRNLKSTVERLTGAVAKARQSEIELRALEQQVEANRKLLESFETRSREAKEFGKINANNLRVVSQARPPAMAKRHFAAALWGGIGSLMGMLLGMMVIMVAALRNSLFARSGSNVDSGSPYVLQVRAQAFARYRAAG